MEKKIGKTPIINQEDPVLFNLKKTVSKTMIKQILYGTPSKDT